MWSASEENLQLENHFSPLFLQNKYFFLFAYQRPQNATLGRLLGKVSKRPAFVTCLGEVIIVLWKTVADWGKLGSDSSLSGIGSPGSAYQILLVK